MKYLLQESGFRSGCRCGCGSACETGEQSTYYRNLDLGAGVQRENAVPITGI